jgi:hypothetical protein
MFFVRLLFGRAIGRTNRYCMRLRHVDDSNNNSCLLLALPDRPSVH